MLNIKIKFKKRMVKNILLIFLCLLGLFKFHDCQQCNYELDIDYRGVSSVIDLNYQTATSAQMCCSLCNANTACNAWTFVVQTYICWLKTRSGLKISTPGSKLAGYYFYKNKLF